MKGKFNSKAKGSAFERYVAKELSLWITKGKKDDCLWRSSLSGGRSTVAQKKGIDVRQCGDLCAVAPEAHNFMDRVFIECKHLKTIDAMATITGRGGALVKHWKKCTEQAGSRNRYPILIAQQNHYPILLCTCPDGRTMVLNAKAKPHASIFVKKSPTMLIFLFDEAIRWGGQTL